MDCPHCQKQLPAGECPLCGQHVLEGSKFCAQCGHLLPGPDGEEPKQLTCKSCDRLLLEGDNYCANCGLTAGAEPGAEADDDDYEHDAPAEGERVACPDGECIGIIGEDGCCTECGKTMAEASS